MTGEGGEGARFFAFAPGEGGGAFIPCFANMHGVHCALISTTKM